MLADTRIVAGARHFLFLLMLPCVLCLVGCRKKDAIVTTKVSFDLTQDELVLVPAYINDKGPLRLVLDTGELGGVMLAPDRARDLGIRTTGSEKSMGAGGTLAGTSGNLESLTIGEAKVHNVPVVLSNEVSKIAASEGSSIDGTVGFEFLRHFVVTLDYKGRMLELAPHPGENPDAISVPFKFAPCEPVVLVPVMLNGHGPYQFVLDTGSTGTVISEDLAKDLGIARDDLRGDVKAFGNAHIQTTRSHLDSLAVGNATARSLPVEIMGIFPRMNAVSCTRIDGILGYSYLEQFRVDIDYPSRTLYITNAR